MYIQSQGEAKGPTKVMLSLPQDVQQLADILPRCPTDSPVIVFQIVGRDNYSKDFVVRREKIADALYWLTGVSNLGEPNNPLY